MKDVYRSAAFCVAATATNDGHDGLFQEWYLRGVHPVRIDMLWSTPPLSTLCDGVAPMGPYRVGCHLFYEHVAIHNVPLNRRAW
jgi:hypothetical protein